MLSKGRFNSINLKKQNTMTINNWIVGIGIMAMPLWGMAQGEKPKVPDNWHLLDQQEDGYQGVSLKQAKVFLAALNRSAQPVTVAIIDSGIDTAHAGLKGRLWVNPKETLVNGRDDDRNGYVDDIHGWSFLGNADGRNVMKDSKEAHRVYHRDNVRFAGMTEAKQVKKKDRARFADWKRAERELSHGVLDDASLAGFQQAVAMVRHDDSLMRTVLTEPEYTGNDLNSLAGQAESIEQSRQRLVGMLAANNAMEHPVSAFRDGFGGWVAMQQDNKDALENPPVAYRKEVVVDDYTNYRDKYYGNRDVKSAGSEHGTHVAGIVAGLAVDARLMGIRAVPDGDEHDKDVALAIRYAVDNGAKVINMSFGKAYSPEKGWVDKEVKRGQRKGVLFIQAAGNEAKDIDTAHNFPTAVYGSGGRAANWITVGASGDTALGALVAPFSNFGKAEVDVFAPGMEIYSTLPEGKYGRHQGTSMAAPVVAGIAALIWSHFPELTAAQVKQCIETSVVKPDARVIRPGGTVQLELGEVSRTGGVVNAFNAVKKAAELAGS